MALPKINDMLTSRYFRLVSEYIVFSLTLLISVKSFAGVFSTCFSTDQILQTSDAIVYQNTWEITAESPVISDALTIGFTQKTAGPYAEFLLPDQIKATGETIERQIPIQWKTPTFTCQITPQSFAYSGTHREYIGGFVSGKFSPSVSAYCETHSDMLNLSVTGVNDLNPLAISVRQLLSAWGVTINAGQMTLGVSQFGSRTMSDLEAPEGISGFFLDTGSAYTLTGAMFSGQTTIRYQESSGILDGALLDQGVENGNFSFPFRKKRLLIGFQSDQGQWFQSVRWTGEIQTVNQALVSIDSGETLFSNLTVGETWSCSQLEIKRYAVQCRFADLGILTPSLEYGYLSLSGTIDHYERLLLFREWTGQVQLPFQSAEYLFPSADIHFQIGSDWRANIHIAQLIPLSIRKPETSESEGSEMAILSDSGNRKSGWSGFFLSATILWNW